ncbi:type II toxin-antitoxin system HipA family toxin [Pseudomonas sp. SWRI92]|uniref:type II toxin-antitoxin system HipA family toxin n=1 Tax=Pseudomonas sp. SWRI92 TaxID=2745499 RepID=UPI001648C96C|nr:type II toxin-antitoxin system HipA family toxin [Pseudomonas sp. SWRI92]MBC3376573.1 type II toxin-antitoxin system HipA family toxin [Pseudomonas sp. SWRI92]
MTKAFKRTEALTVLKSGVKVGELLKAEGKGIYFAYDQGWLATGYNLSPLTMTWDEKPQLAKDASLFEGLHGPFADSLPDGWGMLLMDRYFNSTFGDGTHLTVTALDRLAYMDDRSMGAFEYQPTAEKTVLIGPVDLCQLYEASIEVQEGETQAVLTKLRLAGGSPGGARPKAIVALSADCANATSAFGALPEGYAHWIVKFRALYEPVETGGIEFAYAEMARAAGVTMAESTLLDMQMPDGQVEHFFATRRFDREGERKIHMMTVAALMYANYRALSSIDYPNLLKLTQMLTKSSVEVEKMARLMIFNALSHNHDDHAKNFAFLCHDPAKQGDKETWTLSPAYDVTFANAMGEHTTDFGGRTPGKPTRKRIMEICRDYKYLKAEAYIEQTLAALSDWKDVFTRLKIPHKAGEPIFNVLAKLHQDFER